jgi:hypothetical protein
LAKLLKNPNSTVKIKIEARGQIAAPWIIDDHGGAELRSLHDCFNLSPILHSESSSFRKEEINGALVVAIAALEKAVGNEDGLQAVPCRAEFEEFVANSLGNKDRRKQDAELGHQMKVVQSDNAGTINCAAARPHSLQFRFAGASRKPRANVPRNKRAVFAVCCASRAFRYCTMPNSARSGLAGSTSTRFDPKYA